MCKHSFPNGEVAHTETEIAYMELPTLSVIEGKVLITKMTAEEIRLFKDLRLFRQRYFWEEMKHKYKVGESNRAIDVNGDPIPYDEIEWEG